MNIRYLIQIRCFDLFIEQKTLMEDFRTMYGKQNSNFCWDDEFIFVKNEKHFLNLE